MLKKCVFAALVLTMLFSFCTVFADQDGNNCWCNIDDYGCWNTGEDGGKSYIMFWSEESRQYIMGTGSAPYKFVVEKPGSSNILRMKCGSPAPVVILTAASGTAAPNTGTPGTAAPNTGTSGTGASNSPASECSKFVYNVCDQNCAETQASCLDDCHMSDTYESCNKNCINNYEGCETQCDNLYSYCITH